jgi:hypothetical protein
MSLPTGKGRILTVRGDAIIAAYCPYCGREHRYGKGAASGDEIAAVRRRGFSDEWLPCQVDLPGNFWRIVIGGSRPAGKAAGRRSHGATAP